MRFYTTLGDDGTTDLLGARVGKDDPRVEALGALDEATSAIGLARALAAGERTGAVLIDAQRDLYRIMAELAFTDELRPASYALHEDRVRWLEAETDALAASVELPAEFVLPGESVPGAAADVARTVVAARGAVGRGARPRRGAGQCGGAGVPESPLVAALHRGPGRGRCRRRHGQTRQGRVTGIAAFERRSARR